MRHRAQLAIIDSVDEHAALFELHADGRGGQPAADDIEATTTMSTATPMKTGLRILPMAVDYCCPALSNCV